MENSPISGWDILYSGVGEEWKNERMGEKRD